MPQCSAKSSRTGKRCKAQAIHGGTVCRTHGGAAPQVRNKAAQRLATMIDPALGALEKSLKSKTEGVRLRAAQDILDRNNFKGDNVFRLLTPEGGIPIKLSDDQVARIQALPPDELQILARVLGFLETGERPAH